MATVNLLCKASHFGLAKCSGLLQRELTHLGYTVTRSHPEYDGTWSRYRRNLTLSLSPSVLQNTEQPRYDINLFLEDLDPSWFRHARGNYLIPNQEWFRYRWLPYLLKVDGVLAKTRVAYRTFAALGCPTQFISFTSEDRFLPQVEKDYNACFHLAGNNPHKGTETLLAVWARHPEWPTLHVVQSQRHAQPTPAANIHHHVGYLDDDQLQQYQNRCGIHLCPSSVEGFGHSIGEALSCGALVVTTDGPPMNELVTPQRGLLVNYRTTRRHRLGRTYRVDPDQLERCIQQILAMSRSQKRVLGERARAWYLENHHAFQRNLQRCLAAEWG
jgi:hypothetical protein